MCKNLYKFLFKNAEWRRANGPPPPTLASVSTEWYKALAERSKYRENSINYKIWDAIAISRQKQYENVRKEREERGLWLF